MMNRLSASKFALALRCLYFLRRDVQWPNNDAGPAAIIGTWYHAVACWTIGVLTGAIPGDTPQPAEPDCLGDACELTPEADAKALVEAYPGAKIRAEVAYVYSPRGVRLVGFDIGRNYGELADDEVPGTADVVILEQDRAIVVDWKPNPYRQPDRASEDMQLAFLALCVHLYHGVDTVIVEKHFESEGDGTDDWVDRHTWDAFDLDDVRELVNKVIANMGKDNAPRPGLHCTERYCPIRLTCPKTVEAAAEVLEPCATESPTYAPLAVVAQGAAAIENADHAASLWHRAAAAKALLDKVTSAVKAYCDANGPIPLGDGKELAAVEETRESIDATTIQDVYEPVSQWLTPEEFAKLVSVSVSKGPLEKAIKAKAERGQKGTLWDTAMGALKDAGRVKSKTITKHKVRKESKK